MPEGIADLTAAEITSGIWRYMTAGGAIVSDSMRFMDDGRIVGYEHPNEKGWKLAAGVLRLLDRAGDATALFDIDATRSGLLTLQGRSLLGTGQSLYLQRRDWSARQAHKDQTRMVFAAEIEKLGWSVGDHTYGRPIVFERMARLIIGRYTSIAFGAQIALANHRSDLVSTYPFAALADLWPSVPGGTQDHESRGDVIIGNDVWLGASCFIGAGVKVGDGAIVGAKTVVVDDVPPYTVVVGNPARIVRMRFAPNIVDKLMRLAWWDWPDEKVDRYLPLMLSPDIQHFIREARREEKRLAKGRD